MWLGETLQPSPIFAVKDCAQCYKIVYVRNLLIFVISYNVCPWQAFPSVIGIKTFVRNLLIFDPNKLFQPNPMFVGKARSLP